MGTASVLQIPLAPSNVYDACVKHRLSTDQDRADKLMNGWKDNWGTLSLYDCLFLSLSPFLHPSLCLSVSPSIHPTLLPPFIRQSLPPSLCLSVPPSLSPLFLWSWMNSGLSKLILKRNTLDIGHYSWEFINMLIDVSRSTKVLFSAFTRQKKAASVASIGGPSSFIL